MEMDNGGDPCRGGASAVTEDIEELDLGGFGLSQFIIIPVHKIFFA